MPDISFGGFGSGDSRDEVRSIRPGSRMLGRVDEEVEGPAQSPIEKVKQQHVEEKRRWEKEKAQFLETRLILEEELTMLNTEHSDLKDQFQSLTTKLSQVHVKKFLCSFFFTPMFCCQFQSYQSDGYMIILHSC